MNTPTPEEKELALFAEFHKEYDRLFDKDYMDYRELSKCSIAYANHVLTNHEGFQSNAELKRKLAALQEKVDYWVEHWNIRDVEATKLQQQLTDARKEVEALKIEIENFYKPTTYNTFGQ